jgi:[acyl-carrier-protein] S-malonyltransferase
VAGAEVAALLKRQISSPVRWEASMRFLATEGITAAVEVGPGNVLAGLMKRIDPGVRVFATGAPDDLEALRAFVEGEGGAA